MIRVLIADDQALVRGGFRLILQAQPDMEVVGEAEDGRRRCSSRGSCSRTSCSWTSACPSSTDRGHSQARRLARRAARAHAHDLRHERVRLRGDEVGRERVPAEGRPPEQLADAVRTVAAGDALLAPSITRRLIEEHVRRPPPGQSRPPELEQLTERELEVLQLIAKGLSNTEIGGQLFVSEATVKTHVTRILAKLQLRDRVQAVVLAYESGLVQAGDPQSAD